jgi:hypothetical protein
MKNANHLAAILVAACAASITIGPAAGAAKKPKQQRLSGIDAIRLACLKEIGATRQGGYWYTQGGTGTAQQQRYYDCLDSHTMKRR